MSPTRTTCPYCGVGCGLLAGADGSIKGDPDHPANFGRLCSKGAALGETIDLEGRLLTPRIANRTAHWDEALDLVARRFSAAVRDHGPDSVAFYVSGQLLSEDYYVANKLMKGFIGSANIDTNSRLCMSSSVAGHKRAFGSDTVPGCYQDLEEADLVVLVGSNLAWCHPVLHQRLAAAKVARPELQVVNIDPRKTATTALADQHLQIRPDGDIALFNGLLAYLADQDHLDQGYIDQHIAGAVPTISQARLDDPLESGLSEDELSAFYQLWAATKKVVTVYSQGVNQSECGTDKVNAILNCHLATGRIGTAGCGPFSVTGQPNAMGGREVGGLANMLANHLEIENPAHRAQVQEFWQSPTICTQAGLRAVDLFEACKSGKIKALWVMSTNPAMSLPDADGVAAAIASVPFVAVSDIMEHTDTADLADVLLPATGWGEKNGTVTNSERRISRQRAFLPVPGAARPDWRIICEVAARMGWAQEFDYDSAAEIFAEYVALSTATRAFGRDLDLSLFADVDYAALLPTQWPQNESRFFADGRFFYPDEKGRMLPVCAPKPVVQTGFRLNTGRNRDQWHSMTRSGKAPRLGAHLAEPYVEIHPQDADRLAISTADLVELSNDQGWAVVRALITDRVAEGQLFSPIHWSRQNSSAGWVNSLVRAAVDPVSGQPAAKNSFVALRKRDAAWYGFAASLHPMQPTGAYAAIARSQTGWQGEFAGDASPSNWQELAQQILQLSPCACAVVQDQENNVVRIGFYEYDQLVGLFFSSPDPVALSRAHALSLLGTKTPPLQALAGRSGAEQVDPGATICACMNIGVNTLRAAIAAGASSVEALGVETCAGTSCGSCKPELLDLLSKTQLPMAAE